MTLDEEEQKATNIMKFVLHSPTINLKPSHLSFVFHYVMYAMLSEFDKRILDIIFVQLCLSLNTEQTKTCERLTIITLSVERHQTENSM